MKVLFIGGTGQHQLRLRAARRRAAASSSTSSTAARPRRGRSREGADVLHADVRDADAVRAALGDRGVRRRRELRRLHAGARPRPTSSCSPAARGQYVFISSASAYQKPPRGCRSPSRRRCATRSGSTRATRSPARTCSCAPTARTASRSRSFARRTPTTSTLVPLDGGWTRDRSHARAASRVVVHGDGTSLWTLTHHRRLRQGFVGLLGHPHAIGDSFHITSDDVAHLEPDPRDPRRGGRRRRPASCTCRPTRSLPHDAGLGRRPARRQGPLDDLRQHQDPRLVPDYVATIPFARGAREIVDWYDADPARREVDARMHELIERLVDTRAPVAG